MLEVGLLDGLLMRPYKGRRDSLGAELNQNTSPVIRVGGR